MHHWKLAVFTDGVRDACKSKCSRVVFGKLRAPLCPGAKRRRFLGLENAFAGITRSSGGFAAPRSERCG